MEIVVENRAQLAHQLYRSRQCPACRHKISLWEALAMLSGSGVREYLRVRYSDGTEDFLPIEKINPQTMDVLE